MPHRDPLAPIRRAAELTDSAIVGISGGKDSLAVLELCRARLKRVEGYFMALVPGLDFQERYLCLLEKRYKIKILRLPHWCMSEVYRNAGFRHTSDISLSCPKLRMRDLRPTIRAHFGIDWLASGEKLNDSLHRREFLTLKCPNGVNESTKCLYPVVYWNDAAIYNYLKRRQVPLPPDYRLWGSSFGAFGAAQLRGIKTHYPNDYRRILRHLPFAEAILVQDDQRAADKRTAEAREASGV